MHAVAGLVYVTRSSRSDEIFHFFLNLPILVLNLDFLNGHSFGGRSFLLGLVSIF